MRRAKAFLTTVELSGPKGERLVKYDRHDIVGDLENWLSHLNEGGQIHKANGEAPKIDIALIRRAIAEINALREQLGERRTTLSIAMEDLNASND
jgi:hypothetical protein